MKSEESSMPGRGFLLAGLSTDPMHSTRIRRSRTNGRISPLFILFAIVLVGGVLVMGIPVSQVAAAAEYRTHRDLFLFTVAMLGIAGGLAGWRPTPARSREERVLLTAAVALPCYALFQLLPLPAALVNLLSPAREELLRALEPIVGHRAFATISIAPAATLTHFLLFTSYCIIFFFAREFALKMRNIWMVAIPLVLAAALEAALGVNQFFLGNGVAATGTYVVHEHLAGLLEMALPFAVMYSIAPLRDISSRDADGALAVVQACIGLVIGGLLLAGAFLTLSRGGYLSILASAIVMGTFIISGRLSFRKRLAICGLLLACGGVALFFLTPIQLLDRFSEHTTDGRFSIWRNVPNVIAQFPLFGCGLGGFESAYLRFKDTMPLLIVDYAHNDYLQYCAELGLAGFTIAGVLLGLVVIRVARIAAGASRERWMGLACLGSVAAILAHSVVDFNLYVPANAAVLAWICGIGSSLAPSFAREEAEPIIEVSSVLPRQSTPSR